MSQKLSPNSYPVLILYLFCLFISIFLYYTFEIQKSQNLYWILYPVTMLTELWTGIDFILDDSNSFVNHAFSFRIDSSCSGIKILIIIWTMSIFSFLSKVKGTLNQIFTFVLFASGAYIWTVVANASRITGAIFLYRIGDSYNWSNSNHLHLAEGILFYVFFIISYYFLLRFIYDYRI